MLNYCARSINIGYHCLYIYLSRRDTIIKNTFEHKWHIPEPFNISLMSLNITIFYWTNTQYNIETLFFMCWQKANSIPSKHETFVLHLYNVGPTSSTLVQKSINCIQMVCVYWSHFVCLVVIQDSDVCETWRTGSKHMKCLNYIIGYTWQDCRPPLGILIHCEWLNLLVLLLCVHVRHITWTIDYCVLSVEYYESPCKIQRVPRWGLLTLKAVFTKF